MKKNSKGASFFTYLSRAKVILYLFPKKTHSSPQTSRKDLTAHTGALKKEREADLNPKVNNAGYPSPA